MPKLLPEITSGKIGFNLDQKEVAELTFKSKEIKIRTIDPEEIKKISSFIPHRLKHRKSLNRISHLISKLGLVLELDDDRGSVLRMGYGVKSLLGSFEIKLNRIRKFL